MSRENVMMNKVMEFNRAMNVQRSSKEQNKALYTKLLEEEFEEWLEEAYSNTNNADKELKEMCDMLYIIFGHAANQGWDIVTAFNRVHDSNMSKLDKNGKPVYNESGKVIKGSFYSPPVLTDLV